MALKPINPGELLLHVGVHKTGTTAVQSALADARADLAARGITYPGASTFQHRAVLAGAGRTFGWQEAQREDISRAEWDTLVAQATGTAVISSEFFDDLEVDTARRMVSDLGGSTRVRVVITLRPIGAILPSAWQQRLKTGYGSTYGHFLKQVFADELSTRGRKFWYRHDQVAQVQRWAGIVGADRVNVVVIPEGDRTAIFAAFEGLLGLPEGFLAGRNVATQNRSMTAAEAELVRQINKSVVDELSWEDYLRIVRRGLVLSMVEERRPQPDEARIVTPKWAGRKAAQFGQRFAQGIAASGVNVIGDPMALAAEPRTGKVEAPDAVPMVAAVAGAVAAIRRGATKVPTTSAATVPSRREALKILLKPKRFSSR
jgi:hypothetical protein